MMIDIKIDDHFFAMINAKKNRTIHATANGTARLIIRILEFVGFNLLYINWKSNTYDNTYLNFYQGNVG